MKEIVLAFINKLNWRILAVISVSFLMILGVINKNDLLVLVKEVTSLFK